ncbi:MAG: Glycerophosphoryl diester phosphodiesterase [Paenibacillus sp.]|jgi:glycerophosphoryl diester phosphodiesterase|nr:Glycerophosphoryl diester phosphodiesterase [Paenibacillus sp.]
MEVIEASMISKTGDPLTCEDRYCVTEHYACVIDGATDVSGKRYGGLTSGQIISAGIAEAISALPPDAELETVMRTINDCLIRLYKDQDMYGAIRENAYSLPSAAMVLYSRHRHAVWMVGDCQCMVDEELHTNPKIVDEITANARSLFLEAELQQGKTVEQLLMKDTGFEAVRPFIAMQYYMQNAKKETQYGYAAITGFDFDLSRVKTVRVKEDTEFLVLASDGYPKARATLAQSEDDLRRILDNDPLCFREYKLAKGLMAGNVSFDDRTYLKLKLTR